MRAVIDRFEGEFAVLQVGPEAIRVDWPREYLPDDVEEGSILDVSFQLNREETETLRKRMQKRLERLKRQDRD